MNEWFDNKTVAIIGNAKSLFNKSYGSEIDSHDVVIRINKGIEVCSQRTNIETHGIKVDIWCFNLYKSLEVFDNSMKSKIPQTYKRLQMNYALPNTKFDSSISQDAINEIKDLFTPKKVTTGFRILHYMTKFNPKSVDVYGFDWKETPTFYIKHKSFADVDHDYSKEKQYCYKTYFDTGVFNLKN
jgi:hypothetical protein